jgi:hypothetical protein
VFSGFNDHKITECEVFNVQTNRWHPISDILIPRTKFSAVAISKSRILIFGGKQSDGQRTAEIEEYYLQKDQFKTLPFKMQKERSGFSTAVLQSKIYFCGGNAGSTGHQESI